MKRWFIKLICLGLMASFHSSSPITEAADLEDYCQLPAIYSALARPNVVLAIDASGSMGYNAYSYGGASYDSNTVYEGYFDPSKNYILVSGIYEETTLPACNKVCTRWSWWGRCRRWEFPAGCSPVSSGNRLNFDYMDRIDLLRWVMTGGTPQSCSGSDAFDPDYCNPQLWDLAGNATKVGSVCNDSLDVNGDAIADGGCILRTNDGEFLKVPWNRIYDGLIHQVKKLDTLPRFGVLFYSDNGVRSEKVYVGDFVNSSVADPVFPYKNLIAHINSSVPSGATPTGPAMWDVLNYYAQQTPQYGGFDPEDAAVTGDEWKNPMYLCEDGPCEDYPCAQNFVILLSDGEWNRPWFNNAVADPVHPAYEMHYTGFTNQPLNVASSVESVYSVSLFMDTTGGVNGMQNVAMYGSFDTRSGTWPGGTTGKPSPDSKADAIPSPSSTDWDSNGDGLPDAFKSASDAIGIRDALLDSVLDIFRRTSSGTAASVLSSGQGHGASLLQALYYPIRSIWNAGKGAYDEVSWAGSLSNFWFLTDPTLARIGLREDRLAMKYLEPALDPKVQTYWDPTTETTRAHICDDDPNTGACVTTLNDTEIENTSVLWRAEETLFQRNPADRKIYVNLNNTSALPLFTDALDATLVPYLGAANNAEAANIINYVRGVDDLDGNGAPDDNIRSRTTTIGGVENTWKLGDVINSTPAISSWVPLQTYHKQYKLKQDSTYGKRGQDVSYDDAIDNNYYITSSVYRSRGMVYVGSNDGMLHAFKLGMLKDEWSGQTTGQKAKLDPPINLESFGHEKWAFIPRNVLPYLKAQMDENYCHVYTLDLSPLIIDASIGGSAGADKTVADWRTVLIGGMNRGGACRKPGTCSATDDCVDTPASDPADGTKGLGYSVYFALDITDEDNPKLLWEFSHEQLGYATSTPAVIRIGDWRKNGNWYVVVGSGPTGPIEQRQFKGRSNQNLNIFVLDLRGDGTGQPQLERIISTGIPNAFGAPMMNTGSDTDEDFQDDAVYLGYTKLNGAGTEWNEGGVLRVLTNSTTPAGWSNPSHVIQDIGPVTTSIGKLRDAKTGKLWLYFGTGRYFFNTRAEKDDPTSQRRLFGVKEPCYDNYTRKMTAGCTTTVSEPPDVKMKDVTDVANAPNSAMANDDALVSGWYVNLNLPGSRTYLEGATPTSAGSLVTRNYYAERVITDPLPTHLGVVFFTTFEPYNEKCVAGGKSFIWAMKYDTGGLPTDLLKGKALTQVSTGSIEEVSMEGTFGTTRKSYAIEGVPPTKQGMAVATSPKPKNKVLHKRVK